MTGKRAVRIDDCLLRFAAERYVEKVKESGVPQQSVWFSRRGKEPYNGVPLITFPAVGEIKAHMGIAKREDSAASLRRLSDRGAGQINAKSLGAVRWKDNIRGGGIDQAVDGPLSC